MGNPPGRIIIKAAISFLVYNSRKGVQLMKNIILTIAVVLLFVSAAFAQGSIDGTITDAKGNGIAGVTVTAVNAQGKAAAQATTDESGAYTLENLAAGKYKIAAYGAKGFDSAFNENVVVEDDDLATVDLTLAAESSNGGKTQTKPSWPVAEFAFEVQYYVGGKTYKFFAAEITGLSSEIQPKAGQPVFTTPDKMPGIDKNGTVTIKKAIFTDDNTLCASFTGI